MIKKSYSKTGRHCRVTFKLPPGTDGKTAAVCGDFNNWDQNAKPMTRTSTGAFFITYSFPAGRTYRFRYLIDGHRWENDEAANGYVTNDYGSEDSVVTT